MTEPTNEQIERAAKDAGCRVFDVPTIRKLAILDHQDADTLLARSILAHARDIAEAEAREAAAEHRGHIAGMREAAAIADRMICSGQRDPEAILLSIRQRATAIETGEG